MRTKPITRDEVRLSTTLYCSGLKARITTLPIDSVQKDKQGWRDKPIRPLWAPLLRSLNRKLKPLEPITCPCPDSWNNPCTCEQCGREFLRVHNGSERFCSDRCVNARRSIAAAKAVAAARADARDGRECETCGNELDAKRSTRRFCSTRCRVAAHRADTDPEDTAAA
jgi:endogenous inhibitor of DNA gyrase (YacG/DUF329 family)